jgi:AraC-like DNA-binding protein
LLLKEQHPQQAAIHLQRYSTLKDSLYTRETANRLAANDAEYRAQQLLAESAKERSQHLIHIIVFTLFLVILTATTTFVLLRKRKHKGEDYVAITNHQEQTVDGETQEADEKFAQTLRYEIEQRLTEGMINLEELASAMYMSRGQLNRRVKALTGLTTSSYILSLRLDMACKLLLQFPDKPINEVAQQCGFDNFSYFNRLFKREKGVTPSEYKGSC